MPRLETWGRFPLSLRRHLIDRMRERSISIADLSQLRIWVESGPEVAKGIGTRISVPSKCAARGHIRGPFSFVNRLR